MTFAARDTLLRFFPAVAPRWRLVRLMLRLSPGLALGCAALILLSAALPMSVIIVVGLALERVPSTVGGGFGSAAGRELLWALVALGLLYVGQYLTEVAREATAQLVSDRANDAVRRRLMFIVDKPAGIAHFEDEKVAGLITTARGAVSGFTAGTAASGLVKIWSSAAAAVGAGLLFFTLNWWLPIVVIVACALAAKGNRAEYVRSVQVMAERDQILRRAAYLSDLLMLPEAGKEVRVFGLLDWLVARMTSEWRTAITPVWATRRKDARSAVWTNLLLLAANLIAMVVIARSLIEGSLGFGAAIILLMALLAVNELATPSPDLLSVEYGTACLPALDELERRLSADAPRQSGGEDEPLTARTIRFDGVGFRYPGSEKQVFDGLDLEIETGRSLAIVGVNGAGKTTLIKLLTRLYAPTEGRITIGGEDLAEVPAGQWRRSISAIFQDFVRYPLPARDNIALGDLGKETDDEAVSRAVSRAGAEDIIAALPAGLDTPLSRAFTGGQDLSGGQWQRIALARAFHAVERGANILVLDEPAANLDARGEAELYERFLEITRGLTTIIISHRFSSVRRADRIVVMNDGRIVEQGTHEELLDLDGEYAEMFRLQAERYASEVES
ncbi:ABC transporter ATP-binding protein [Nonomuraea sp. NPDC001023]|uniref:ABC transporter ATP-binding protein n=1 Tax=unclassified Nonomuraea TaxID=2593643 RepID=UPI0033331066